jgi:hypothetical protein
MRDNATVGSPTCPAFVSEATLVMTIDECIGAELAFLAIEVAPSHFCFSMRH